MLNLIVYTVIAIVAVTIIAVCPPIGLSGSICLLLIVQGIERDLDDEQRYRDRRDDRR